jgi:maleylacetate reductase
LHPFVFDIARLRVVFGRGTRARTVHEVESLGARQVLVVTSPSHARSAAALADQLGARCAGIYDKVAQHVPVEKAAAATSHARALGADVCVAIGGGSAIGLAKAIALETGIPILAIPTTYSGSEMTSIWGLTANGVKRTGKDPKVQARAVIYDSELFTSLPPAVAGPSGMNAMAHAVEGLYAQNANPIMSSLAQEGIAALVRALPLVYRDSKDLDAQDQALYGSCLSGILLNSVGMSLHHKLCHALGGAFNTPHAETHAIVLPYAAAFNLEAAPDAKARMTTVLGTSNVGAALYALGASVGAPRSLKDLGLKPPDLDRVAELATRTPYPNPRPVTRAAVRELLEQAYQGKVPNP